LIQREQDRQPAGWPSGLRIRQAHEASTLYLLLQRYLEQLPGAIKEEQLADGSTVRRGIYTPHSLRATTATLLLDGKVDIVKVKDLLGHRHITTTQIYDKRRRSTSESASHLLAI
jgi:site-specific recombinase XerD